MAPLIRTNNTAGESTVETKLLMTVPEAAAALGISRSYFYVLAARHGLILKIGRLSRVRRASLEAMIESLSQDGTDDKRASRTRLGPNGQ